MESHGLDANKAVEVLVAEDSATQAEQLRNLLEERDYTVTIASNGKLALEAARNRKPTLIISDIVMPEMDGYAFCKAVKTDPGLRDVPVILVTSLSSIQDIAMGLECGADNFIRKPYDPRNLLSRIDYILSNRELRGSGRLRAELEIYLGGKKHVITSEREQILDLLVSSYEEAIQVNEELKLREKEVRGLNADLERRAAQLEQSNRELEAFSYSVSHDLRAPLRAIDGFTRIVLEDYADSLPAEGQRQLGMVREQTQKMAALIDDLLELARVGRRDLGLHPVKLGDFVRNCLSELRSEQEGRKLELVVGELPTWNGDPILLKQLFLNLLSNALKYTRKREAARIEVGAERRGAEQVVFVRDNGAGFDMAHAEKLFGVFQRLHAQEEYSGTGIGLAIVRRVAERHGGRVWAEAMPDRGATFFIAFPAVQ